MARGALGEFVAHTVVFFLVLAHIGVPTLTVDKIKRAVGKDMLGHLDVGALEATARHGAYPGGRVPVHGQVVGPEQLVLGGLVQVGHLGAEQTLLLHGALIPVLAQIKVVLQTRQTHPLHGKTGHPAVFLISTLETHRFYRDQYIP
jgi:hypothetical protein